MSDSTDRPRRNRTASPGLPPAMPMITPTVQADLPTSKRRPTSVAVLSVWGILVGMIEIISGLLFLIALIMSGFKLPLDPLPVFLVLMLFATLLGGLQLVAGVEAWSLRPNGRRYMKGVAILRLAYLALSLVVYLLFVSMTEVEQGFDQALRGDARGMMFIWLLARSTIRWALHPVLVLIFFNKPKVARAFAN